jgi:hypothetical protein
MMTESELTRFNKKFDAFFEIFRGDRPTPRLGAILRALSAAVVSHVTPTNMIKQSDIGRVEHLLRRVYFASPKSVRRAFKDSVAESMVDGRVSVPKAIEFLSMKLSHMERLAVLQCLYTHIHHADQRSPYEPFLLESLRSAFGQA